MIKKVLIDIGHPAQVHQFKYLYNDLKANEIEVLIVAKDKEVSEYLLKAYNIEYLIIDKTKQGIINKISNLPIVYYRMFKIIKSFKPDIILSRFSFQSSHLAYLLKIPHVGFTDTEHVNLSDKLTVPFVDIKLTSNSYCKDLGKNHFRYDGNIELFYLHPKRFKPDKSIKKELNVDENERYAIIRFVSWDAHHDIGKKGMSNRFKYELVNELSKQIKVFITSESELPLEFEQYKIKISPDRMHHALAFADIYVGEGGTMASEAACLGTPSVYINELNMGYLEEERKYKLLYNYKSLDNVVENIMEIVSNSNVKKEHKLRLKNFLSKKINVTTFVHWFIINYPKSVAMLQENPNYPLKFK